MSKQSKKIETLAANLAEARGTAVELRMRLNRAEESRAAAAAPPPVASAPPPAPAPVKTHHQVYRELRETNPYLAADYILRHQHELHAPASPEPNGAA